MPATKAKKIKVYPAPVLRGKSQKVKDPLDAAVQKLVQSMIVTMDEANGLGLAAPQVGEALRLCVVRENETIYVLINPQLTAKSKQKIIMEEGCLSFPGKFFPIERPETVKVRYTDESGKKVKAKASGLLARAFQHEIDHLDGVLIIDRAKKMPKIKNL
ncbi:peptide deformylase [Patescibacteria group bacterium]|nr:MAG: peptide deformylase [Patescibacteria group bacterium]